MATLIKIINNGRNFWVLSKTCFSNGSNIPSPASPLASNTIGTRSLHWITNIKGVEKDVVFSKFLQSDPGGLLVSQPLYNRCPGGISSHLFKADITKRTLSSSFQLLKMADEKKIATTSTSSDLPKTDLKPEETENVSQMQEPEGALSTKEKLKRAVRDYGATVIIFHVTVSLMSLGFFYLLVSSGLDVVTLLGKIGISESLLKSKVTEEASKFVVAYAVHKIFAPLRITLTLTATPFIVKKLRSMGIIKQAVKLRSS